MGHCVLYQVRKLGVSDTPETKMGVLLGHWQAGATLSIKVGPAGMPSRGPDMSVDMQLEATPEETESSEASQHLAEGMGGPPHCCGLAYTATTAA
jgi:hypothetical protein